MLDLQVRNVQYDFPGLDQFGEPLNQRVTTVFFNPKAGVTWLQKNNKNAYLFFGKSSKEPNRDDYVASSVKSRPTPETLYNVEIGERIRLNGWQLMANYYWMYYKNQLILTGQINDVGAYTRTNIPNSYRTGIELAWSKLFFEKLTWNANIAVSSNKVINYDEYVDNWDDGTQNVKHYAVTDIAFSPAVIAYDQLNYIFAHWQHASNARENSFSLALISKYVGKQYADNTSSSMRQINAYALHDFSSIGNFHRS